MIWFIGFLLLVIAVLLVALLVVLDWRTETIYVERPIETITPRLPQAVAIPTVWRKQINPALRRSK